MPARRFKFTNQRFGELVALKCRIVKKKAGYDCRCDCGGVKWVRTDTLGKITSCHKKPPPVGRPKTLPSMPSRPRTPRPVKAAVTVVIKPVPGSPEETRDKALRLIRASRATSTPWREVAELVEMSVEECKELYSEEAR